MLTTISSSRLCRVRFREFPTTMSFGLGLSCSSESMLFGAAFSFFGKDDSFDIIEITQSRENRTDVEPRVTCRSSSDTNATTAGSDFDYTSNSSPLSHIIVVTYASIPVSVLLSIIPELAILQRQKEPDIFSTSTQMTGLLLGFRRGVLGLPNFGITTKFFNRFARFTLFYEISNTHSPNRAEISFPILLTEQSNFSIIYSFSSSSDRVKTNKLSTSSYRSLRFLVARM